MEKKDLGGKSNEKKKKKEKIFSWKRDFWSWKQNFGAENPWNLSWIYHYHIIYHIVINLSFITTAAQGCRDPDAMEMALGSRIIWHESHANEGNSGVGAAITHIKICSQGSTWDGAARNLKGIEFSSPRQKWGVEAADPVGVTDPRQTQPALCKIKHLNCLCKYFGVK